MPNLIPRAYLSTIASRWSAFASEPNNSCAFAYAIELDTPYNFFPNDLHDWYRFELERPVEVEVRVENFLPLEGQVAAYNGDNCESVRFLQNYGSPSLLKILSLGEQPAGTYFVYVSNDGVFNSTDTYRLLIDTR